MKKKDPALTRIREQLLARATMEAAEGKDVMDAQRKAMAQLEGYPVKRIVEIVQYLQEQILPSVKKRSGAASPEAVLFGEIVDVMFWALASADRVEYLTRRVGLAQLEKELLKDRVLLAEGELLKYQTAEDLLTTDALNTYVAAAKKRLQAMKEKGKSP